MISLCGLCLHLLFFWKLYLVVSSSNVSKSPMALPLCALFFSASRCSCFEVGKVKLSFLNPPSVYTQKHKHSPHTPKHTTLICLWELAVSFFLVKHTTRALLSFSALFHYLSCFVFFSFPCLFSPFLYLFFRLSVFPVQWRKLFMPCSPKHIEHRLHRGNV